MSAVTDLTERRLFVSRGLTPREMEVAHLLLQKVSPRYIGDSLFISARTVGFHGTQIYRKMGVTTRPQLIVAVAKYVHEHKGETE